jgi:hypothetical protein
LLNKGLKFIPTPTCISIDEILIHKDALVRKIKLQSFFSNTDKPLDDAIPRFVEKSSWTPGLQQLAPETITTVAKLDKITEELIISLPKCSSGGATKIKNTDKTNLSPLERVGLKLLTQNSNLTIKSADKGGAIVVQNTCDYIIEAHRQLQDLNYYRPLNDSLYLVTKVQIAVLIDQLYFCGYISDKQRKYFKGPENPRPRRFYLLPKIHKDPVSWPVPHKIPPGRPIVSDVNSESYRICQYIDHFLRPLACQHQSYVKDTYDFINKIKKFPTTQQSYIVTADVTALYTNMKHDRIMETVTEAFNKHPDAVRPDKIILKLLEIILTRNDFQFDNKTYLQTCGLGMGKVFSPNLANLYLLEFDEKANTTFRVKPDLYYRFLDDIIFIWSANLELLLEYEKYLNNLIPGIQVTFKYSQLSNDFLDTTIYKTNEQNRIVLAHKVFFKPTDTHQLLHADSYHPPHTHNGILKSQLIRFKRLSYNFSNFVDACKILFNSLINRGYTWRKMYKKLKTIWFFHDETSRRPKSDKKLFPITVPYDLVGRQLAIKYKNLLQDYQFLSDYRIITAYKNHPNLYKKLVHSQVKTSQRSEIVHPHSNTTEFLNTENTHIPGDNRPMTIQANAGGTSQDADDWGFNNCDKPDCLACKQNTYNSDTFTSYTTNNTYNIKNHISCYSRNLIYLITCLKCKKQYIGETGRQLRERLTDHRSDIKLKKNTPISNHFNLPEHEAKHLSAIGIEIIKDGLNPITRRRQREDFWKITLNTIEPGGLNKLNAFVYT